LLGISGDGNVSFEEFVEIVSNMGAATDRTADQEEKELRDAFRVSAHCLLRSLKHKAVPA
jgi:Ca2+-binding EF-hand superfamily protein